MRVSVRATAEREPRDALDEALADPRVRTALRVSEESRAEDERLAVPERREPALGQAFAPAGRGVSRQALRA